MGQKVNPLVLRLNITQRHRSRWYAESLYYSRLVFEDQEIRQYLFKKYPDARISEIFITRERKVFHNVLRCYIDPVRVLIYAEFPGAIGSGLKSRRLLGAELARLHKSRVALDTPQVKYKRRRKFKNKARPEHLSQTDIRPRSAPPRKQAKSLTPVHLARPFSKLFVFVSLESVINEDTQASSIAFEIIDKLKEREPFRPLLKKALYKAKESKIPGIRIQISGRLNGAEIARTE